MTDECKDLALGAPRELHLVTDGNVVDVLVDTMRPWEKRSILQAVYAANERLINALARPAPPETEAAADAPSSVADDSPKEES